MKKKIVFVINRLGIGGVERSLVSLCNSLCERFDLSILIIDRKSVDLIGELSPSIEYQYANKAVSSYMKSDKLAKSELNVLQNLYKAFIRFLDLIHLKKRYELFIARKMRHIKCDIVVSYTGYPGVWDSVVESINATNRLVYIHNNPYALNLNKINIAVYYQRFDIILCVSRDIKDKMISLSSDIADKLYVSYNLINKKLIDEKSREPNPFIKDGKKKIITIARIENRSKRFDRIINVVKTMINKGYSNFSWHIIGDGIDRGQLVKWITEEHLQDYIILEGYQDNPYKYIKNADLFVLTSDYEGLPVTLMEVRYLNVIAITTCFSCATEIIDNGITGYVCDFNTDTIANTIIAVLFNENEKKRLISSLESNKVELMGEFDYSSLYQN